jgi:2'-5' RNA ligase
MDPPLKPTAAAEDSAARRLFVGWMADPASREALAALQDLLRPRLPKQGLRWVPPADLHLTLRFLGATPPARERAIAAALPGLAARTAGIAARTDALRWWPSTRDPRVLVLLVQSRGALERLAAALEAELSALGVPAEPRRFRAHLTLARVAELRAPVVDRGVGLAHVPLAIERLSLVDSAPRADGTRYREIAGWPLGPR